MRFQDGEVIGGTAFISLKPGKHFDHQGIKVELIGQNGGLSKLRYSIERRNVVQQEWHV